MASISTNPSAVVAVAHLEQQLATRLAETAETVDRSEFFDIEQRAEVYTILQAIRADTELHCGMAALLAGRLGGEQGDA